VVVLRTWKTADSEDIAKVERTAKLLSENGAREADRCLRISRYLLVEAAAAACGRQWWRYTVIGIRVSVGTAPFITVGVGVVIGGGGGTFEATTGSTAAAVYTVQSVCACRRCHGRSLGVFSRPRSHNFRSGATSPRRGRRSWWDHDAPPDVRRKCVGKNRKPMVIVGPSGGYGRVQAKTRTFVACLSRKNKNRRLEVLFALYDAARVISRNVSPDIL